MTGHRRNGRRTSLYAALAAAASLATIVAMAGTAGAQARRSPTAFAAQAQAFGLSAGESRTLQSQADAHLAEEGGTQIAANKIRLTDGSVLVLALPGAHPAYGKDGSGNDLAQYPCNFGHFCAFSGTNFTGDVRDYFKCRENPMPFTGHGSWENNQYTGTIANFESSDHVSRWHDDGAYSQDEDADWTWVVWLRNC